MISFSRRGVTGVYLFIVGLGLTIIAVNFVILHNSLSRSDPYRRGGSRVGKFGKDFTSIGDRLLALREIIELFTPNGIQFVAGHGTLLGIVRGGQLIENDNDVDLFVLGSTFHLVSPVLRGFHRNLSFEWDEPQFVRVFADGWGPVDLYSQELPTRPGIADADEPQILCNHWDRRAYPLDELFPTKLLMIESLPNLGVPVPVKAEDLLRREFGSTWRTPHPPDHPDGPGPVAALRHDYARRHCRPAWVFHESNLLGLIFESCPDAWAWGQSWACSTRKKLFR